MSVITLKEGKFKFLMKLKFWNYKTTLKAYVLIQCTIFYNKKKEYFFSTLFVAFCPWYSVINMACYCTQISEAPWRLRNEWYVFNLFWHTKQYYSILSLKFAFIWSWLRCFRATNAEIIHLRIHLQILALF